MKKIYLLFLLLIIFTLPSMAHTINYQLDKMDNSKVVSTYLKIGFIHIIPLGYDHILFILCVFFLNTSFKKIIVQASMFTLAHTISLALAATGIIKPPTSVVEPLIALSILFLAIENIYYKEVKPWRLALVFCFGLVHGMGFASALSQLGLPSYAFAQALISFNVGVEIGQLTIILFMYFFVAKVFSKNIWYRKRIVIPTSLVIAVVSVFWAIQRIFFIN